MAPVSLEMSMNVAVCLKDQKISAEAYDADYQLAGFL